VYKDSCLELFIWPEQDERYLNIEVNPLGAMLIGFGAGREGRKNLLEIKICMGSLLTIDPGKKQWSASCVLPFSLLREIYGRSAGPMFLANVYKCGGFDDHYGMWRESKTVSPDFHRPEYVGALVLG
jgi:hypothetical protein